MTDNNHGRGGRAERWPRSLDTRDPEGIADFTLGLGYSRDSVVNALVKRCNLDPITAKRIVDDVATKQEVGNGH